MINLSTRSFGSSLVSLVACLLPAGMARAETPNPKFNAHVTLRRSLPHRIVQDRIRVFYSTEGPHAVAQVDADKSGHPDQVDDVLTQTRAAWLLWTSLGFADPLTTKRFSEASWLDVHLISKATLQSNGLAYDEIQRFSREGDPPGTGSLCFDVATSIQASANLTPAHELFHILQNSVCYFKNRWFTEGTARWSEKALGTGGLPDGLKPERWPPDDNALEAIFTQDYQTSASYWAPLLTMMDSSGTIPADRIPELVLKARYVNGQPVLKDHRLTGWVFIRDLFKALDAADDTVRQQRGLMRWSEAEQFSPANNAIIHRTVKQAVAAQRSRP